MSIVANWSYPTAIRFGAGRISEIADACAAAGIKKPLLITDRGLATMEITTHTLDLLEAAGLGRALFADVDQNPNEKNAAAGVAAFKEGGHDGVVAFGGGLLGSYFGSQKWSPKRVEYLLSGVLLLASVKLIFL